MSWGMRKGTGVALLIAGVMFAAACSSGGSHVSTAKPNASGANVTAGNGTDASGSSADSTDTTSGKHGKKSKKSGSSASGGASANNGNGTVSSDGSTSGGTSGGSSGGTSGGGSSSNSSGSLAGTPGHGGSGGGNNNPTTPATVPTTPTTVACHPVPFDPNGPINLGCEAGVTPEEQARAEKLLRDTLAALPKYADWHAAYNVGYRSIGDGFTGDEHWVNWFMVNDGRTLDPNYPESLVYNTRGGQKTLEAAMYILPLGSRFTDAPDVGGKLTQWHIHDNLCLRDDPSDPLAKVVGGLTSPGHPCPAGSSPADPTPMLHVWIVKNKCGPFAPLEGIGGGSVPPGESALCDLPHGSVFP